MNQDLLDWAEWLMLNGFLKIQIVDLGPINSKHSMGGSTWFDMLEMTEENAVDVFDGKYNDLDLITNGITIQINKNWYDEPPQDKEGGYKNIGEEILAHELGHLLFQGHPREFYMMTDLNPRFNWNQDKYKLCDGKNSKQTILYKAIVNDEIEETKEKILKWKNKL